MTETGFSTPTEHRDWWSRRPRRSRSDSKVAGVAGGLARYLGVDPILFRVGFVALTILGGVGILAYSLLWLMLPAEGDEVSAGEALLGRGRSSVSPIVAAILAIAVLLSIFATFNWGFPFWPALIIGMVAFHVARKQRRGPFRPGSEWERRLRATADDVAANRWSGSGAAGQTWGDPSATGGGQGSGGRPRWGNPASGGHQGWGNRGGWGGGCSSHGRAPAGASAGASGEVPQDPADSPFDTPAFWDTPGAGGPAAGATTRTADPFRKADPFAKAPAAQPDPFGGSGAAGSADPTDTAAPRTSPPSWDPLGAAPFAWDLPDIDVSPKADLAPSRRRTPSPVIARATGGLAVLVIAASVLGIFAGWWNPAWAAVAGSALAVVAAGLMVQALRGRSLTLIGPGVFLSFATIALSITGISGTASFGELNEAPTSAAAVQSEYKLSVGDALLDLSQLNLARAETVTTSLNVNAGQAKVLVPADATVNATCTTNAGPVDCLGVVQDGPRSSVTGHLDGIPTAGTINLEVHVGAGNLEVSR